MFKDQTFTLLPYCVGGSFHNSPTIILIGVFCYKETQFNSAPEFFLAIEAGNEKSAKVPRPNEKTGLQKN